MVPEEMLAKSVVGSVLTKLGNSGYEFIKIEKENFEDIEEKFEVAKLELARAHNLLEDTDAYARNEDHYLIEIVSKIVFAAFKLKDLIATFFAGNAIESRTIFFPKD